MAAAAEPVVTVETVKYSLNGSVVLANRRETPVANEDPKTQWVFNLQQIQAANGVNSFNPSYQEKVVDSEEERDEVGKSLLSLVAEYKADLAEAQSGFQDDLNTFFPAPVGPPATPYTPVPVNA